MEENQTQPLEEHPQEAQVMVTSEIPEPAPTDDAPTYMVAEWAGLPQYLCTTCGHQTWDLDAQQVHQQRMHDGRMQPLAVERPTAPAPEAGAVGTAPVPEESQADPATEDAEAATETSQGANE